MSRPARENTAIRCKRKREREKESGGDTPLPISTGLQIAVGGLHGAGRGGGRRFIGVLWLDMVRRGWYTN